VAWQEGAANSDIAAAVVDGTGQVLGGGAETLSEAGNTQERPALSYDTARGRYLAVWADCRNSAEEPDAYGQLYRDDTVVATDQAGNGNVPICLRLVAIGAQRPRYGGSGHTWHRGHLVVEWEKSDL